MLNRGWAKNPALHRTPKAMSSFTNWQIIGLRTSSFQNKIFFAFAACELGRYSSLVHLLPKHKKFAKKLDILSFLNDK